MSLASPRVQAPMENGVGANKGDGARERLILFTRFPMAGRSKTRLIPALGGEGAARLQRRLTHHALREAEACSIAGAVDLEIQFDGAAEPAMRHWLGDRFSFCSQAGANLGQRMCAAFAKAFKEGCQSVVLMGADCPELTARVLNHALAALREYPVVLGPATDGGYYLVGLRQPFPELFSGPVWGSDSVLADSLQIIKRAGLAFSLLQPLSDIDRPEDLFLWRRFTERQETELGKTSVIIAALNEEERIGGTVKAALQGGPHEIIVVDGGSDDQTVARAKLAGATVLKSRAGRARQLNAGASRASGGTLLFLHGDTLLPGGYVSAVQGALARKGVSAGAFSFALRESFRGRWLVEHSTNLRSRVWQMPYGDQGVFVRRSLFEELGGYADMAMLEDYELVRRLRRCGRIVTLSQPALTSARRWQRLGFLRTTLLNKWIILGYRFGWPIEKLAASYRKPFRENQ
ncbi:MAG TPA: TIGR04283 family arsenosugar biosynthesis glycosyltransferase [Verrucomicrobiae bacterium]|nr:TIGR04283 family arsenosugar biosynthesis glycosyltransferase [Verrucomicrobiae bacterium]